MLSIQDGKFVIDLGSEGGKELADLVVQTASTYGAGSSEPLRRRLRLMSLMLTGSTPLVDISLYTETTDEIGN